MKLKIYTDWWARWNPWNAWIWVYIIDENWKEIEKRYKNIGIKTNNDAEYTAVYLAITRAVELWCKEIDLFSDSNLVVNQLSWNWKIKEDRLKIYKTDIDKIIKENKLKICFTWIKREENKEADRLSNVAMDELK
jgi:ribonuclease HI